MQVDATQERQETRKHKIMPNMNHIKNLIQNFITRYFMFKGIVYNSLNKQKKLTYTN
jgi:hypothetical protein